MEGTLPMGQKDLYRCKLMEMVLQDKISLKEAAIQLKVCYRQAKRIYSRYRQGGDAALLHGNCRRTSNHRIDPGYKARILSVYKQRYVDFGPTFAAEKLEECESLQVSKETLRRWLVEEVLWQRKRRSNPHRSRRERRRQFGELVQFDGSHHDWFEGRRGKCCLMNMVDDATGITLSMLFEQETTASAMILLSLWIKKYGMPQAMYCDHKNSFVSNREATIDEQLRGEKPRSHFQKSCDKLGIAVIAANSPQAKGRVERNHAIYQDRFVKELRLSKISSIEEANEFLTKKYLVRINEKFSRLPADSKDGHVPLMGVDLSEIFSFEYERSVSRDFVVHFQNRLFQINNVKGLLPRPKDKVIVRIRLDDSLDIYFKENRLCITEITEIVKFQRKEYAKSLLPA